MNLVAVVTLATASLAASTVSLAQIAPAPPPVTLSDPPPLAPGARVTINLQDADLPALVRAIGNITGRRFILGGTQRAIHATIYSPTPVTADEAYEAFLSALALNGLTAVRRGRFYTIEDTDHIASSPLPVYTESAPPTGEHYVTRVQRMSHLRAEDAAHLLEPFRSRGGEIVAHAASNTLAIADTSANIARMLRILDAVDIPAPGAQFYIERVRYASAVDLAARLNAVLADGDEASRPVRLFADERTNSIIIVATEPVTTRVRELIRRTDAAPPSPAHNER